MSYLFNYILDLINLWIVSYFVTFNFVFPYSKILIKIKVLKKIMWYEFFFNILQL